MHDLAEYGHPLGCLFDPSEIRESSSRYRLTGEQLRSFDERGYVAGVRVLTDPQVDLLLGELQSLMDPAHPQRSLFYEFHSNESDDPATVLFHALGAWRISAPFHDLLWHPAITVPASQLLGGAVRFWHDQLFCKPPRHGGVVSWHQDYSYWTRTQPMAHLTCWIALDDATIENGCVCYVPGSHRWDLLPRTALAGDMNGITAALTDDQKRAFQQVPIELARGEATFHHPLMVHGSQANRADRPRRGAVVNMIRDGVRSAANTPLLDGVSVVPAGEKLEGRFFPLLFA